MRYPEFHYSWEWLLESSPERLCPLVADTNRFNRDTGLPAVRRSGDSPQRNARRRLRFSMLGINVAWEEEPFEWWVRPQRFGVVWRGAALPKWPHRCSTGAGAADATGEGRDPSPLSGLGHAEESSWPGGVAAAHGA